MVVHIVVNFIPIRKLHVGIQVVWVIVSRVVIEVVLHLVSARVVIEVVLHLVSVVVLTTMPKSLIRIRMVKVGVVLLAVH